jgi:methyltransferase (TIGR00027 family)
MKSTRPSRTAQFVAFGRAVADVGLSHVAGFCDPTARVFLHERARRRLAKIARAWQEQNRGAGIQAARRMADIMALRTVAIDQALRDAIADGATQLVILGAGYDGRAWRLPELKGVRVFEVDHRATQGEKRARTNELPPAEGIVTFVPIDFEREPLDDVLQRAGHDRSSPTCWIWEGVVMYLTHGAMHATLAAVAGRSAPGSTLIVNYHTVHRRLFARLLFRLIGEPQISAWTRNEMADELRSVGFLVREDTGMLDWNQRFAQGQAKVERAAYMRIATARTPIKVSRL